MKREEAIKIATGLRTDFKCESDTMVDFCNTIIKALEQEPCEDWCDVPSYEMSLEQARQAVRDLRKFVMDNHILPKSQPCEDCVSRAELKKWLDMNFSFGGATKKLELFDRLDKELPTVTPKAKVAKWIRDKDGMTSCCSECGQTIFACQEWFKRCPNCEAKMESEE